MKRDPYRVLGVHPAASDDVIKAAWRARIQGCHPDRAAADGPAAVAAAEAETKTVNEAYNEIKQRRARGEVSSSAPPDPRRPRRPGARPRRTRIKRRPIQPEAPVSARDGIRRAEVAVAYADTLCGRWRRHAASIRAARKQAGAAVEAAETAAEASEHARRAAVAERDTLSAGIDAVAERITAHLRAVADKAERAADKAARINERVEDGAARTGDRRRLSEAVADVLRLAEQARGADLDAARIGGEIQRLYTSVVERIARAEAGARGTHRQDRFASSAAKRARDALNQARRAVQSLDQAVKSAGEAVERATVVSATAVGLCKVDLQQARDESDRFLAQRAATEAARHRDAAAMLTHEQARVVKALGLVPERMQELRGFDRRASEAARRARADREIAHAAVEEIRRLGEDLPSAVVGRAEATAAAALARVRAAADQVAHHEHAGPG